MTDINNLQELSKMINGLALTKVQAVQLNRAATVAMRKVVGKNIRSQKDVYGVAFKPRSKRKFKRSGKYNSKIRLTSKMFTGVIKNSLVKADQKSAFMGFNGKMAYIVRLHNDGGSYKTKMPSGRTSKVLDMPKRQFFGWNEEMMTEVKRAIINKYAKINGVIK